MVSEGDSKEFLEGPRLNIEAQRKLADQYLSNITLLQGQLELEEQKLIELLQVSGVAVLQC